MGVKGNAFYEETVPFYICGKELRRPLCLLEGHRAARCILCFVLCLCCVPVGRRGLPRLWGRQALRRVFRLECPG